MHAEDAATVDGAEAGGGYERLPLNPVSRIRVHPDRVLSAMLVTLRLFLEGGDERLLAREIDDVPDTPLEIVQRLSRDGRVPLGDRESCELGAIERVELVPPPEPQRGPAWGPEYGLADGVRLRDEDVATALSEGSQEPKSAFRRQSPSA